jgi:phosphoribosylanthranilate isomerase
MGDMSDVKFKICGLTRADDAEAAVAAGAWALGLNFWKGSKRRCPLPLAAEIGATYRRRAEVVGVFVNATLEQVVRTAEEVGLTMLQFHGDEGPVFCAEAARRTGAKTIKAARVRGGEDIQALAPFHTDFHLLDTYVDGVRGGTGETFAWDLVRLHTPRGPRGSSPVPVILAGGLTAENVAEAIAVVRPFAVDVAGGIESAPGIKDLAKLTAFAEAVAQVNAAAAAEIAAAEAAVAARVAADRAALADAQDAADRQADAA